MDMPLTLTAEEAVLLDHLFRHGPRQTEGNPAAVGLVEKGLAPMPLARSRLPKRAAPRREFIASTDR